MLRFNEWFIFFLFISNSMFVLLCSRKKKDGKILQFHAIYKIPQYVQQHFILLHLNRVHIHRYRCCCTQIKYILCHVRIVVTSMPFFCFCQLHCVVKVHLHDAKAIDNNFIKKIILNSFRCQLNN